MNELVGTYQDEWRTVVNDSTRQRQFRQFVNTVSSHSSGPNAGNAIFVSRRNARSRLSQWWNVDR